MNCKGKTESNSYRLGMTTRINQRLRGSKEKSILEYAQETTILSIDAKTKVNNALMIFEKEKIGARNYIQSVVGSKIEIFRKENRISQKKCTTLELKKATI